MIRPRTRKFFTTIYGSTARPYWPSWALWCSSASSPSARLPHWSYSASSSPSSPSTLASASTGTVLISCGKFFFFIWSVLFSTYASIFVFFCYSGLLPVLDKSEGLVTTGTDWFLPSPTKNKGSFFNSCAIYCPRWQSLSCQQGVPVNSGEGDAEYISCRRLNLAAWKKCIYCPLRDRVIRNVFLFFKLQETNLFFSMWNAISAGCYPVGFYKRCVSK